MYAPARFAKGAAAPAPAPRVVRATEGRVITALTDTVVFKLGGEETGGAMAVGLVVVAPGGGPPPHVHAAEDELFLVLEGRFSVWTDGTTAEVGPGDAVFLPRGVPHTYCNVGSTPGRFWVVANPSGFEHFYEAFSQVCARDGGPDPAEAVAVAAEHGITLLLPAASAAA